MDNKLNNAMNEIDEGLIEEAAHAGRAERNGLKLARNIGLSVCGVAAAAAALTFGINHHLASLPEKVDLLPAESQKANSDISDAIMEGALRELPVELVDVEDVDPARLSAYDPYFVEAGDQWVSFDNDGNMLSKGNTILVMDCGGYWLEYDATAAEGFIYELLDVRGALAKAENVLEASLTDVRMGTYDAGGYHYTVTAQFDNGKCLHYSLSCDTNHEHWTMKLLSDEPDYLDEFSSASVFFREEKAGVYDSVRFNDLSGAYICDNNGEIRVVTHTPEGYFGYLPFGGKEDIYTIENAETGSRLKYCVKENGDILTTTYDFLNVIGEVEHQEDIQNVVLPSWSNLVDDEIAAPLPEIGASERYHLSYAPDYDGLALSFFVDKDGKVFLYDFSWLYPCTMQKDEEQLYLYRMKVLFYPEGRETPDGSYLTEVPMNVLIDGDTWTLANDYELFIDEQGKTKRITLYKGTEFTPNGGGMIVDGDPYGSESEDAIKAAVEKEQREQNQLLAAKAEAANQLVMEEIIAARIENGDIEIYPIDELICPVNDTQAKINAYFGYDDWTTVTHYGIDVGDTGGAEIYAAQSGTVIIADTEDYYGNYVVIDHGDGYTTLYAHCSDITVKEGQTVSQGDVIGRIGAAGSFTTGDCLHFEIRWNGKALDPVNYLAIPTEDNSGNVFMTAEEQQELNEHWSELIASVPDPNFLYPAGGDYAIVEHMYGHAPDSGYYAHYGIDIGVGRSEPVLAAADGEVILAQWYYGYGNCVMIQHDNGVVTVYGHCEKLYVSNGDTVTRGQTIAAAGASGQATSPHLHFEVKINDENVDPALFEYQILVNGELSERTTFD